LGGPDPVSRPRLLLAQIGFNLSDVFRIEAIIIISSHVICYRNVVLIDLAYRNTDFHVKGLFNRLAASGRRGFKVLIVSSHQNIGSS
jgi:hypothetical protein